MAATEGRRTTSAPRSRARRTRRSSRGQARYVDNLTLPGMLWMAVVRSPYAHARITNVDVSKALAAEGVVAAFSGADLADEWAGSLPCAWPVTEDMPDSASTGRSRTDKARYAGDGVAVVVAESRALAKDAAELVEVDYEPLPAVTDVGEAVSDGAPLVHDEFEENRATPGRSQTGEIDKALRRGRGHRQGALPAAAADPERDRAARRARAAGARDGRVHDVVGDAGAAHRRG